MSIEAMKMALEALEYFDGEYDVKDEITALRAAIAEAEQLTNVQQEMEQEPVALQHKHEWFRTGGMEPGQSRCIHCGAWAKEIDPPHREWVELTDNDILWIKREFRGTLNVQFEDFARAIEANLKEKNS
ncbi:MAG: hypothetical protein RLZZ452_1368 [Pseudomonadota bacterium]|jgi:hypothetical protein